MTCPRVVIAGTQSGVGKTSVSLAVMAGFQRAGRRVQAYKVGPDYIDPSYHEIATGRPSHNLDDWMMGEENVSRLFDASSGQSEIAIVEGVMGLFDGAESTGDAGSTAKIAKLLKAPVILVVDVRSMARSVAATVRGFQALDPEVQIAGVILNRVASENHLRLLREAIQHYNQLPVLGALFREEKVAIPERHLGLQAASENKMFGETLETLTSFTTWDIEAEPTKINLRKVLEIASQTTLCHPEPSIQASAEGTSDRPFTPSKMPRVRIGYAKDRAFHFYYQANLDFLTQLGAELIPFSPLEDEALPRDLSALYFGGGFPEIYAEEIQKNKRMRQSIQESARQGMPVYAECGGLIYLSEALKALDGSRFEMAGVIPGTVEMTERLQNFGYAEVEVLSDSQLAHSGETFRGHEFHYSRWDSEQGQPVYRVEKRRRNAVREEGYAKDNVLASYVHCHFFSYPQRARALIQAAEAFQKKNPAQEVQAC